MKERDKFLTEAMGECWHEGIEQVLERNGSGQCSLCGEFMSYPHRTNFGADWRSFGKLWEWAQRQEWWEDFLNEEKKKLFVSSRGSLLVPAKFIHPDRFANAVYEFLKRRPNHETQH